MSEETPKPNPAPAPNPEAAAEAKPAAPPAMAKAARAATGDNPDAAAPAAAAKPVPATAPAGDKPATAAPAAEAKPSAPPPPAPVTYPRTAGVTLDAAPKASLKRFLGDAFGLLKGMGVTFGYIRKPSRVVTRQYPENRGTLKMTERFRGQVVMPHDEAGDHTCTACTLCEKACPNGSISILTTKNIASKRVLGAFVYRLSSCTLCNLCIEACPFDAIRMGHGFEMATFTRDPLDIVLNKKEGR